MPYERVGKFVDRFFEHQRLGLRVRFVTVRLGANFRVVESEWFTRYNDDYLCGSSAVGRLLNHNILGRAGEQPGRGCV
jgi:hypothetical protein